jgi:hypothetical protein
VAAVQSAFDFAEPLNLMLLSPVTESGTNNFISRISSDDNATVEQRPQLTLTFMGNHAPGLSTGVAPPAMAVLSARLVGAVSNASSGAWSKVSGPGEVAFGSPAQETTPVIFSMEGEYVLRLSASNDLAETYVDLPVSVQAFTPPVLSGITVSEAHCVFEISGPAGWSYLVQASTNLTSWTTLLTTNPATLPFTWTDSSVPDQPARFYRVQMQP